MLWSSSKSPSFVASRLLREQRGGKLNHLSQPSTASGRPVSTAAPSSTGAPTLGGDLSKETTVTRLARSRIAPRTLRSIVLRKSEQTRAGETDAAIRKPLQNRLISLVSRRLLGQQRVSARTWTGIRERESSRDVTCVVSVESRVLG